MQPVDCVLLRRGAAYWLFLLILVGTGGARAEMALQFTEGSSGVLTVSPAVLGWEFSVNQTITVDGLGVWKQFPGFPMTNSHAVGLWSGDGTTLIASATVAPAAPTDGEWAVADITPVVLSPGTYVIGAAYAVLDDAVSQFGSNTTAPEVSHGGSRSAHGASGLTFPGTMDDPGFEDATFGPNFRIVRPPEPPQGRLALQAEGGIQTTSSSGSMVAGWSFTSNETVTVDALGLWLDSSGTLANGHQVGLWSSDGSTLLASATVGPTSEVDGDWAVEEISPVVLPAGSYLIGADYIELDSDFVFVFAGATVEPELTYGGSRIALGASGLSPPLASSENDDGIFGPNFRIAAELPIPVPAMGHAGLTLLALALLTAAGYRMR